MNNIEKDAHDKFGALVINATQSRIEDFRVFPEVLKERVWRHWMAYQYRKIQFRKNEINDTEVIFKMWCHLAWAGVLCDSCKASTFWWGMWKKSGGDYYLERLALILGFELTDDDKRMALQFALDRVR